MEFLFYGFLLRIDLIKFSGWIDQLRDFAKELLQSSDIEWCMLGKSPNAFIDQHTEKNENCRINCLEFNAENNKQCSEVSSLFSGCLSVIEHWLNIDRKMHGACVLFRRSLFDSECTWQIEQKQSEINSRHLCLPRSSFDSIDIKFGFVHFWEHLIPALNFLFSDFLKHVSHFFCRIIVKRYLSKYGISTAPASLERHPANFNRINIVKI